MIGQFVARFVSGLKDLAAIAGATGYTLPLPLAFGSLCSIIIFPMRLQWPAYCALQW
jgi:hypothetical protein